MSHPKTRFRTTKLVVLSFATALLAACGRTDLPAGPEGVFNPPGDSTDTGAMRAMISDDPSSTGGTPATFSGTIAGRGDVEVSTNNKTWYTMGTARDFSLELQTSGVAVELTASVDLPPGPYRFVRINWAETWVTLKAGSRVGSLTLDSDVAIRLGDTALAVMTREVKVFELAPGAQARIVVELNSEKWLREAYVTARQINKKTFQDRAVVNIVAGN